MNSLIPVYAAVASAVVSVAVNAFYFHFYKKDEELKMEQYKTAYSGVFKEKLTIYKELITAMDDLRELVVSYGHSRQASLEESRPIMIEFNKFVRLNKIGSIFYDKEMSSKVKLISNEIREVLDLSIKAHFFKANDFDNEKFEEYLDKLTKLTNGDTYINLQDELINDIKNDFKLN